MATLIPRVTASSVAISVLQSAVSRGPRILVHFQCSYKKFPNYDAAKKLVNASGQRLVQNKFKCHPVFLESHTRDHGSYPP
jgi:hypothetical protein